MKNPSIAYLRRKADALVQQVYVPLNPQCLVCGSQTSEMHHVIQKKQCVIIRWNPDNLVPLCKSCHCKHHVAGDPSILATIIEKKGMDWFNDLQTWRQATYKISRTFLQETITRLEGML